MKTVITLGVCLFLAPCRPAVADDLAAALVERAGLDALGYLRIENPSAFLGKLDGVGGKFGSRVSDDLPLFAQRFLKNPLLAGVAMDRPWAFIFLNPHRHTNNLVVITGVSDAALFCDSFGKGGVSNVKPDPATAVATVRHFSETEDSYDHAAYTAALRAGKKVEPLQFRKSVNKQYYVTARDGQGVIVGNRALLDNLIPAAAALGHDRVRGDLAMAVRVPGVLSFYEKEIKQRKDSILESIQAAANVSTATTATRPDKSLSGGFDAALNLARQVEWFEAAFELDGGRLKLRFAASPLPGTAFGRALAGQQPLGLDEPLLAMLPARVAVLGAARFTKTPEWTGFVTDLMQPVAETADAGGRDALRALAESWDGSFVRAMLAPATNSLSSTLKAETGPAAKNATAPARIPDHNIVEVYRVADVPRARQAQRRAVETGLWTEPAGRLKYESNIARHAGAEIDRVTLDPPDTENAAETHFIQQVAFVGKFGLAAQGADSTNNIRRLITAAKAPPVASRLPAFKTAIASCPKKNNGVFFMSLADYVSLVHGISAAAEDAPWRRLQSQLADAKAMHVGWLTLQPRAASVELIVPLDTLLDIQFKNAPPAGR